MTYFNNPYAQQAYQGQYGQMMQSPMMNNGANQFNGYNQAPMYQQPNIGYNQNIPKVDFQGVIVNSFDDVKTYPVPLGGTVLLLNKNASKFYLKSLGENGNPVVETYDFNVSNTSSEDSKLINNDINISNDMINKLIDKIDKMNNRLSNCENSIKSINKEA